MKVKTSLTILLVLVLIVLNVTNSYSYPGGITGRTKKTTNSGCGSCHTQGSTITGTITGPDTVVAGTTVTFTLTLTATGGSGKYGVDIAAKIGTLGAISGQGVVLSSGELIHNSGITFVSPKTINFNYTAPSTPQTDTLYATVDRGYSGAYNWAPNRRVVVKSATGIINNEVPVKFYISQNFPNPFNPVTKINYGLAKAGNVSLKIYDITGKQVANLVNEYQNAGNYYAIFDASRYSSGIYYYEIQAGDFREVKKMSLIK